MALQLAKQTSWLTPNLGRVSNSATSLGKALNQGLSNGGLQRSLGNMNFGPSLIKPAMSSSGGLVLGASTSNSGQNNSQQSGGQQQGQQSGGQQQGQQDFGDGGYGEYLSSLDAQIQGLGDSRSAQEAQVMGANQQGRNLVDSQYAQGQSDISNNQQKTLRDLATNLTQSFQQGNQFLGTRGASDSSAAGRYAYALTKQANQARGDIQTQVSDQLFKLKNTYDTETKNLELDKNNKISQIGQWFAEAQNALRGQKGQVALQRSQQAQQMAMQMAQQVQQQAAQQKSTLDQWAANHSTNFQQLQQNLGRTGNFQASNNFNGTIATSQPQQSAGVFSGYGYSAPAKKKQNPGLLQLV